MSCPVWRVARPSDAAVEDFESHGLHPLAARLLAARGFSGFSETETALRVGLDRLHDPFLLPDMDAAVKRIKKTIDDGGKIAVYGDYDADGITATALLVRELRSHGADCLHYIPDRVEEGYGLNVTALRLLAGRGVTLLITVDTGITAIEEAALCASLGMELIITDHHECRDGLPQAAAVVNPRRADSRYPFNGLAGVGVAFKLACALCGDARRALARYGDIVAIGTVADVMPVTGENRTLIALGLQCLEKTKLPGLRALLGDIDLRGKKLGTQAVSFSLAPRINAAGRVGQAETALELFLTDDPVRGKALAERLGILNSQRQAMENVIMEQAAAQLDPEAPAIVLAGEGWPQGVAGIVAARFSAKYGRPAFIICLEGEEGRGSARSVPGLNLAKLLSELSHLLGDHGGHALAAGFSVPRANVAAFKEAALALCAGLPPGGDSALDVDCAVEPSWLDAEGIAAIEALSPFGPGFPSPVFCLEGATVASVVPLGGGRHVRAGLGCGGYGFDAVWFGQTAPLPDMGVFVDVAFRPEINRFRGQDSVQLQITGMRPSEREALNGGLQRELYGRFTEGAPLAPGEALSITPVREDLVALWRVLCREPGGVFTDDGIAGEVAAAGRPAGMAKVWVALDVLRELDLVSTTAFSGGSFSARPRIAGPRGDLSKSDILQRLRLMAGGGEENGK